MTGQEPIPYGRQHIDEDDIAAVVEVLRSDWLTTGPAVVAFEEALSEVSGGHPVVAVNSGTAALHCAYAAAGVGPGTNIVTTPLTFAATATAALHLGADVRFADIDEGTLLIDPDRVAEQVNRATRAIVAVDYAGQPADMDRLREIAQDVDAVLIEDAAHSIGAKYKGRPVGDLADLTTYSFHPVKTITTGEGGAVVVRDQRFVDSVRKFRNHGLVRERGLLHDPNEGPWHQEVQTLGLNYRMPDVLAALGISQLRKLERFMHRRANLVDRYRVALGDVSGLRLVEISDDSNPSWHLFPVQVFGGRRREVYEALRDRGILAQVHYLPVNRHPLLLEASPSSECPIAATMYERLLSLPLYPDLLTTQQQFVIAELRAALSK